MTDTPKTLFRRLRDTADHSAWALFNDLYRPWIESRLIRRYAILDASDRDDICQLVMKVAVQRLPDFQHHGGVGAARKWLTSTMHFAVRQHLRTVRKADDYERRLPYSLEELEDPDSDLSRLQEAEHSRETVQQLIRVVSRDFAPHTMRVFEDVVLNGLSPDDAALKHGMRGGTVKVAVSRVLRRLKAEAADWIE